MANSVTGNRRLAKKVDCPTGKRRFATKLDCLLDHAANPRPIRAYKCPTCGDWHASSKYLPAIGQVVEFGVGTSHNFPLILEPAVRERLHRVLTAKHRSKHNRPKRRRHGRPVGR